MLGNYDHKRNLNPMISRKALIRVKTCNSNYNARIYAHIAGLELYIIMWRNSLNITNKRDVFLSGFFLDLTDNIAFYKNQTNPGS